MIDTKIDHIAVAVRDIRSAMRVFCDVMGASFLFGGDVPAQAFRWAQFAFPGGGKLELVTPIGDGFVKRFLEQRGEGVHHVTLKTPDIAGALAHVRDGGVEPFGVSLDGSEWKEAFIHPRDAHGVLVQIAETPYGDEDLARHHLSNHTGKSHRHLGVDDL